MILTHSLFVKFSFHLCSICR